ncbi:MAG: glycosyltransferase family 4 protein [Acidobacteriia bacterium]|nr:glycosyltransferase family 4 protein [Terriglobia bacterium]
MPTEPRPRALFLTPESPFPLAGGGALRSASLLYYLAARYDVDVIVFRQPGAPDPALQFPAGLVRRVSVIPLPAHRRGVVPRGLRNAIRLVRRVPPLLDRFSGFDTFLETAIHGQSYAVAVIEHFWCAPYWQQVAPVCGCTVMDLHNVESVLHARCAAVETGFVSFAHRRFEKAALALEQLWLPRFSRILTASEPDAALARARAPQASVTVYPNAIPLPPLPSATRQQAVIFSGNLGYHPNISAVRFFRQQVWPLLRDRWPALVWRLVGKNPEAVRQWTSGDERIEVRGPVDDAVQELSHAQIAVAPILAGSGTRLKILEAWAAALPVVSTRLGAEGLPVEDGRHLLLADSGSEFAAAVTKLLDSPQLREKLGRAGRQLVERQFTWEAAWKNLDL